MLEGALKSQDLPREEIGEMRKLKCRHATSRRLQLKIRKIRNQNVAKEGKYINVHIRLDDRNKPLYQQVVGETQRKSLKNTLDKKNSQKM